MLWASNPAMVVRDAKYIMNYNKIYNNLIFRGQSRILVDTYCEKHHIIPRCVGGSNAKKNIVRLTPEEHYIAHQLLIKIYPEKKGLMYAAAAMCRGRASNKLHGWLRRKLANAHSVSMAGEGNSQFGRYWITNLETSEVKRIDSSSLIPVGWIRGKTLHTTCEVCGNSTGSRLRKFCIAHKPIGNTTGKCHSSETKLKIGAVTSLAQRGDGNSQFGTIWITDGIETKKIKKDLIIPTGWYKGRSKVQA